MDYDEYQKKANGLNYAAPLEKCCDNYMDVVEIEPLEGRNTLKVDRTCIVECSRCNGRYISDYD